MKDFLYPLAIGLLLLAVLSTKQCQVNGLKEKLETVSEERDTYKNANQGLVMVNNVYRETQVDLRRSIKEVTRISDSLAVRSGLDLRRAHLQVDRAETTINNLRESMRRDTVLTGCADLFPSQ